MREIQATDDHDASPARRESRDCLNLGDESRQVGLCLRAQRVRRDISIIHRIHPTGGIPVRARLYCRHLGHWSESTDR